MRHLGLVRSHTQKVHARSVLLTEICARTIKSVLYLQLRLESKKWSTLVSHPYQQLVLDYFNLLFGTLAFLPLSSLLIPFLFPSYSLL